MIPKYLYAMWPGVAPALGNHLWQSTLFAIVAGLLTLLLRKNRARVRYWLWLAASVKFLVPFSMLVMAGGYFCRHPVAAGGAPDFPFVVEQVVEPFVMPASFVALPAARPWPVNRILFAVWAIGFVVLVCSWW